MCGIAGWIGPDRDWEAERLRGLLLRRGPDGSGIWKGQRATLIHTRLAIIGLGEEGAQPMVRGQRSEARGQRSEARDQKSEAGADDAMPSTMPEASARRAAGALDAPQACSTAAEPPNHALVFNGEIYNYRELRRELEAGGAVLAGHSDTEVLLRLMVREGNAALDKLAGMFAFALYDEAREEAILARDAFGIKPLYYRIDEGTLAFASEAAALRRDVDALDPAALEDFFRWGSVPEPATLSQAIRQVPAGHFLRFDARSGEHELVRWHDPKRRSPAPSLAPATALRAALEESVARHLVSDVPVGFFLSGGIDSTALVALARTILGPDAELRTFSIGFEDPGYDESATARRTAEHFGCVHTEWRMSAEDGRREVPAYLAAMDQPGIDGFNTWCVSRLAAREGLKVVLSGLGGDEWFAGYGSFARVPRFRAWHRRLGAARGLATALLGLTPVGSRWRRLGEFFASPGSWLDAFHAQRGIFTRTEARELARKLGGAAAARPLFAGMEREARGGSAAAEVSALERDRYMRNQLLRDSDVYSMAHGLEVRVPLVDVRLAAAIEALPEEERLRPGKALLLEAVPEIPDWVKERPKHGFRFPFQQWVESGFGDFLAEANAASPVPLKTWFRTWAVAVALRGLGGGPGASGSVESACAASR